MNIAITKNESIIILTGAGISQPSGLKTFRDNNGLWENHNVYEVASPQGFENNPALVWDFYNQRRQQLRHCKPNEAHKAITRLQAYFPNTTVITQNVDNLHEKAENSNIIHMHGTLEKIKCTKCSYSRTDLEPIEGIPHCPECSAVLRPDVVWFGEIPYHMGRIHKLLQEASLFIAIGTSGTVYPAAGFIDIARYHGAHIIYINKEKVRNPSINHFVRGSAEITVPEVVDEIIADNQTD